MDVFCGAAGAAQMERQRDQGRQGHLASSVRPSGLAVVARYVRTYAYFAKGSPELDRITFMFSAAYLGHFMRQIRFCSVGRPSRLHSVGGDLRIASQTMSPDLLHSSHPDTRPIQWAPLRLLFLLAQFHLEVSLFTLLRLQKGQKVQRSL